MPPSVKSVRRLAKLQEDRGDDSDSSSDSNSGNESDGAETRENLQHFHASDMMKAVDGTIWASSSDDDEPRQPVPSILVQRPVPEQEENSAMTPKPHRIALRESSEKRTEIKSTSFREEPRKKTEVKCPSISIAVESDRTEERRRSGPETGQNLGGSETEKDGSERCRRRSPIFSLLQFKRKEQKTKVLTLDEQIVEMEKKIARKMNRLQECQMKLQEMKNQNTH